MSAETFEALVRALQNHVAAEDKDNYVSSFYCVVASEAPERPGCTTYDYISSQDTAVHTLWGLSNVGARHAAQMMDRHRQE